jgi:hypothetical protein
MLVWNGAGLGKQELMMAHIRDIAREVVSAAAAGKALD